MNLFPFSSVLIPTESNFYWT